MHYQITEDEFQSMEDMQAQIGLICGLICQGADRALSMVTSSQLYAFIAPLMTTMEKICASAIEREKQAIAESSEQITESKAPQVLISPELLIGLMDAASGKVTDATTLFKLWDELYAAGVEHAPYSQVSRHFLEVLRDNGQVLHVEIRGGEASRSFLPINSRNSQAVKGGRAKSRKREQLTASA